MVHDHGQNKARITFHFKVDRKRVRERVQNEELIKANQLNRRKNKSERRERYPIAEQKMNENLKSLRKGKSVKRC